MKHYPLQWTLLHKQFLETLFILQTSYNWSHLKNRHVFLYTARQFSHTGLLVIHLKFDLPSLVLLNTSRVFILILSLSISRFKRSLSHPLLSCLSTTLLSQWRAATAGQAVVAVGVACGGGGWHLRCWAAGSRFGPATSGGG